MRHKSCVGQVQCSMQIVAGGTAGNCVQECSVLLAPMPLHAAVAGRHPLVSCSKLLAHCRLTAILLLLWLALIRLCVRTAYHCLLQPIHLPCRWLAHHHLPNPTGLKTSVTLKAGWELVGVAWVCSFVSYRSTGLTAAQPADCRVTLRRNLLTDRSKSTLDAGMHARSDCLGFCIQCTTKRRFNVDSGRLDVGAFNGSTQDKRHV